MAGIYIDDLHPNCTRKIQLTGEELFVIKGIDAKNDAVGGKGVCNHFDDFIWTIHGKILENKDGKITVEADFTKKDEQQNPSNATNYDPDTRKRLQGIFDPKERTIQWLVDGNHWRKIHDRFDIKHNENNKGHCTTNKIIILCIFVLVIQFFFHIM